MASHLLFSEMDFRQLPKRSWVVEIGSLRERPSEIETCSSYWLQKKALTNNLQFTTVDMSEESYKLTREIVGEAAVLADGVSFLNGFGGEISALYLDNYDVLHNDAQEKSLKERAGAAYSQNNMEFSNRKAAEVHLAQVRAALKKSPGIQFVAVDDTLRKKFGFWGKGALVVPFLLRHGFVMHRRNDNGVLLRRAVPCDYMKPKNLIYPALCFPYFGQSASI